MNKLMPLALLSVAVLAGCGSDSGNGGDVVIPPQEPQPPVRYENLDVQPLIDEKMSGSIKVYLGPYKPCGFSDGYTLAKGVGEGKAANHPYCVVNPTNPDELQSQLTVDDSKYVLEVTAQQLNHFMGGQSINSKLFQPGQYSVLDVLFYLSQTRSDLQMLTLDNSVITSIEQLQFDEAIGTYRFKMSWDRNGDGQFSEADNVAASLGTTNTPFMGAEENYQSEHWYGRFTYFAGEFLREGGSASLETLYDRLDEFVVKDNTFLRFESFDPLMTERREQAQKQQVERTKNGGEVQFLVDFEDEDGLQPVASIDTSLLKPYNLRGDWFIKDNLNAMDILMALHEQDNDVEVNFTYWPTLSTNANVGSYAVTEISHGAKSKRAYATAGWVDLTVGEPEMLADFANLILPPVATPQASFNEADIYSYKVMVDHIISLSEGKVPYTPCQFLMTDEGVHTTETAAMCVDEWGNMFGGYYLHQMADAWVSNYIPGAISVKYWENFMRDAWNPTEKNNINSPYDNHNDTKYPIYDLSGDLVAPMNDSHFGWGIADCGLCHSLDSIHATLTEGDSPALPEVVQPHFCASCHGNNGAPDGHGETARCFWCHSKDKAMKNHGEASMKFILGEAECLPRTDYKSEATRAEGNWDGTGPCAWKDNLLRTEDHPMYGMAPEMMPHDQAGNYIDYPDHQVTEGNNDWRTSNSMPDPYSCLTCHANK